MATPSPEVQRDILLRFELENAAQLPFSLEQDQTGRSADVIKSGSIDYSSNQFFVLVVKVTDDSLLENNIKFVEIVITVGLHFLTVEKSVLFI